MTTKKTKKSKVTDDMFNFDSLRLVEKPDSPKNAQFLPQTLEGCEGYLNQLPLRAPNVDQKIPTTIRDMINILTDPTAAASFEEAPKTSDGGNAAASDDSNHDFSYAAARREGMPSAVYDYTSSEVMKGHLRQAKNRSSHIKAPGILGHVVKPGCISLYKKDGKTFAVTEGRWWLNSYKASWVSKQVPLDEDVIAPKDTQVLIIRVPPGSVGRITEQGAEVLLDVGTHVFNSGLVSDKGTVRYADAIHIKHGRYNYVRVPRGKYARVWAEVRSSDGIKSLQPRLLQEGLHFIDSHLFRYDNVVDVSEPFIAHGSIYCIGVEKGNVARVWHDNSPRLLGEGDHVVESTCFSFQGTESIIKNHCISHGTITILRVTRGNIALVYKDSEPTFIDEPGLYEFDSPDFSFYDFKDVEEPLIQLGSKKIILVKSGQVGVTYDQGKLQILPGGRHVIDSATHVFHRFLSTQQKSIRLSTLNSAEKMARSHAASKKSTKSKSSSKEADWAASGLSAVDPNSDLTICETKDLVKVGLRADVFYSIEDPEKCILKIESDELEDLVRETAVATLTNIIRSTALNQIAQSKAVSAGEQVGLQVLRPPSLVGSEEQKQGESAPTAVFFERVHDEFLYKLHDDFMQRYGVDIANIRIESFKIMDEELADQISKHALTTAQIENEMANLEGKSLISTTEERTAAEVRNINAEAESASLKVRADGENERKLAAARAAAESIKIDMRAKAEAEADAILLRAKAESEAIRLKSIAESERASLLSKTTLGQQEALLAHYSEMVIESNRGVEKVIYLDPSVNRDSPFALGSLQNLNNDLHSLSQLGVAAEGATNGHRATNGGNNGGNNGGTRKLVKA